MKTIIAGSRHIHNYDDLLIAVKHSKFRITEIISGGARGVDVMGECYARENNIPLVIVPAQWEKFGKRAGFFRNTEMATMANALIALWDGESRGTKMMIDIAYNLDLSIFVHYVK